MKTPRARAPFIKPEVRTTQDWGYRARDLAKDPTMIKLTHGFWAKCPDRDGLAKLEHWEKAALLQPFVGPDVRVSHLSAGKMWGFPLSPHLAWIHDLLDEPPATPMHDLRPHLSSPGRRSQSARGHVMHRGLGLEPDNGLWGSQVTSAVETLLALQPLLPGWRGVVAVDFLLAHGDSMQARTSMNTGQLTSVLDGLPAGTRGVRDVRQTLARAAERTWSPMETVLRLLVEHFGFPRPVPNHGVPLPGQAMAYVDLAWPELKVGLEYNGSGHYLDASYTEEMHRLNQLGEQGWRIRNVLLNDLKLPHRLHSLYNWLDRELSRP